MQGRVHGVMLPYSLSEVCKAGRLPGVALVVGVEMLDLVFLKCFLLACLRHLSPVLKEGGGIWPALIPFWAVCYRPGAGFGSPGPEIRA